MSIELNKKYLEQSGADELIKKIAYLAAGMQETDAALNSFIEQIGKVFYGSEAENWDDLLNDLEGAPVVGRLDEVQKIIGDFTKAYKGDSTVTELLNDLNERLISADEAIKDLNDELHQGDEAKFGVVTNPLDGSHTPTVRGEVEAIKDDIKNNSVSGADGDYADGHIKIKLFNRVNNQINSYEHDNIDSDGTIDIDLTDLTKDSFLKDAKQVISAIAGKTIDLYKDTVESDPGYKLYNILISLGFNSASEDIIAYDPNTLELFATNASADYEPVPEYIVKATPGQVYLVFVFETQGNGSNAEALDNQWLNVANIVKAYNFYVESGEINDLGEVTTDHNADEFANDYDFNNYFKFDVEKIDKGSNESRSNVTYKLYVKEAFAKHMRLIDDNKKRLDGIDTDIATINTNIGDLNNLPEHDGSKDSDLVSAIKRVDDELHAEVDRATKAEGDLDKKIDDVNTDLQDTKEYTQTTMVLNESYVDSKWNEYFAPDGSVKSDAIV